MSKARGRGTVVCKACGAGVPVDAAACAYCGGRLELPKPAGSEGAGERLTYCTRCATMYPAHDARCPRCPPASGEDRGGTCPRCKADLAPEVLGTVTVDRCTGCRGLWFDGNEIEHVIDATTEGIPRDQAHRLRRSLPPANRPVETVRYLQCVRCGEHMTRRLAARGTGIIVDICAPHGVWFDADEFRHFATWCAAGGLEVLRHDGIAAAEARRRSMTALPAGTTNPAPLSYDPEGGMLLFGIGELLRGLGRILD